LLVGFLNWQDELMFYTIAVRQGDHWHFSAAAMPLPLFPLPFLFFLLWLAGFFASLPFATPASKPVLQPSPSWAASARRMT
jgi:hypothetical protein